jgi:hypothetical protein
MKRPILPSSRLGWWAFGLGIATLVLGVLLPSMPDILARALGMGPGDRFPIPVGFTSVIVEFILAVSALVVGVVAMRRRERSWLALVGFAVAVLIGGFWILFALGEVLSPH